MNDHIAQPLAFRTHPSDGPVDHMFRACAGHRLDAIQGLLDSGVSVDVKFFDGSNPLIYAASLGLEDQVALFIGAHADLEARGEDLGTALHGAAAAGRLWSCLTLVESGANHLALYHYHRTPMQRAINAGHVGLEQAILAAVARKAALDALSGLGLAP